ncbi:MAG: hypothetical protein ACRCSM_10285 [Sediminibacterium sp.]|jgi:hypothetical protein|nr:hypothetical protein [Chitinophagaceae bacterium]MCA6447304.1 hypothetical protein [Chitinophagaceae bacterium]
MLISHEELFINTVQDLRSKIKTNKTYHLVRACGLCRHLLLDGHPLLYQANKKYRLPIIFHIKDYTDTPISNDYKGSGGRTILPLGESIKVTLDDFLKTKIHYYGKNEFTVKDFILIASHYYGGVHSGNPDEKQQYLSRLNKFYNKETNISFWHMNGICKVILRAMRPLEIKIKKNIATGGFSPQYSAA